MARKALIIGLMATGLLVSAGAAQAIEGTFGDVTINATAGNQTALAVLNSVAINANGSISGVRRMGDVNINATVGNQTALAVLNSIAENLNGSIINATGRR